MNGIYLYSHLVFESVLGKINKAIGKTTTKTTNSTKTTNY